MPCTLLSVISSSTLQYLVKIKGAVKQLILANLLKCDKNINKSGKFLSIKKSLESKEVDVEIPFLIIKVCFFDNFKTKFQKEEPMIHLLYPSTEKLLKTLVARLLKSDACTGRALKYIDMEDDNLQLSTKMLRSSKKYKVRYIVS